MSTVHTPDPSPEHNAAVEASSLPRHVECRCGHDWKSHFEDTFAPQCIAPRCACLRYIPVTAGTPEPAALVSALREPHASEPEINPRGQQGPTVDELLKAGKRSQIARTVRLAEKIALMVHDLRSRVADERRAAEERRKAEQEKQRPALTSSG